MERFQLRRSLVVSLGIHAVIFLAWFLLLGRLAPQRAYTIIEVEPVAKNDSRQNRIVQTTRGEKTPEAPPNAFQGEHNQTVDRETVSRNRSVHMGQQARAKAQRKVETAKAMPLSTFGVAMLPRAKMNPQRQLTEDRRSDDFPKPGEVPQDYIRGLKESETTALNTREYMFFGYFQRIRERLDLAWTGHLREQLTKLYRRGRQLASDMDHTTRTLVTLNSKGEVVRVQVVEESGTHDLDEAAIRAFNDAGPFPNPPHGMVDASGVIQIRWDFVLRT